MKSLLLVTCVVMVAACKFSAKKNIVNGDEVKTNIAVPAPPASVAEVQKLLAGKSFTTKEIGLLSSFAGDSTIMWWPDIKDTSAFYQDAHKEGMAYTLRFVNDTAYESMDGGKLQKGIYAVDDETHPGIMSSDEGEAPGVKLRLTTMDSNIEFGPTTSTVLVKGADEHYLLLTLNRDLNGRKVVVLMER